MSRRPNRDTTDTTVRGEGVHFVDGHLIRCCEQGETNCPCTCHAPELPEADCN